AESLATSGILDLSNKGSGFLRRREASYLADRSDVHVPQRLVQQFGLRAGDEVTGELGNPHRRAPGPVLHQVKTVNGQAPETSASRPDFAKLTAIHPNELLPLDCNLTRRGGRDYTDWVIDLLCPFGKGQRALIVAPAKAGKTMVLQAVAEGI